VIRTLEAFTKRSYLAILAQLWDPIGLISPVTITFRIDLQDLWSSGNEWDDVLPEEAQKKWAENLKIMNHLSYFFVGSSKTAASTVFQLSSNRLSRQ
jgi:hypothetical protein